MLNEYNKKRAKLVGKMLRRKLAMQVQVCGRSSFSARKKKEEKETKLHTFK